MEEAQKKLGYARATETKLATKLVVILRKILKAYSKMVKMKKSSLYYQHNYDGLCQPVVVLLKVIIEGGY